VDTTTVKSLDPELVQELRAVVGDDGVTESPAGLKVYECDGMTLEKATPRLVVHPRSTEETARVLKHLSSRGISFIARGAGTGLAGGTIALEASVIVVMTRMKRILEIDLDNRRARVEAGTVNLLLTREVESEGFLYAPDPSSQQACTIGGNVATNSGGPHTLKYGVTVDHVLGLRLVLPDGSVVDLEAGPPDAPGYDLTGLVVGHEGTFGIVTEIVVRLIRRPKATRTLLGIFDSVEGATQTVSDLIARGMIPAAVEMMDNPILAALNNAFGMNFPEDAAAVLLIEIDGLEPSLNRQVEMIDATCRKNDAREVRIAKDESERLRLWAARKKAFGAIGRLSPNYMTADGVVPRTKLPEILDRIRSVAESYRVSIVNVFHAGDGNLHPCVLYDERDADQVRRVIAASNEILEACLELGGSLTGEHGIGIEKIGLMHRLFSPEDLDAMRSVRGVFDPDGRSNPGKTVPMKAGACIEVTVRKQVSS
jgi:glycolate oxidase